MTEIVADLRSRVDQLEKRLQMIEAFLDREMQNRQHAGMLHDPGGDLVNPWYGCSHGIRVVLDRGAL